ncbi:MAG: DHH family phosphoesterase, partial [Nanoarchaeota archaeon]|nr:DHH family phosphoesterase [Nanoarchaeota archaeon]
MTTLKQIKQKIESSIRPFALFDDDPDGLCSFLQLKREYPCLEGIPVKGKSVVEAEPFLTKIRDYCPDLIIILDKPEVSEEFRQNANLPIIWIDHHPVKDHRGTKYFNPSLKKDYGLRSAPPVSYIIHKMLNSRDDIWIAAAGSISDKYNFCPKEFIKKYKHLLPEESYDTDDIIFKSKFGQVITALDFSLKGKITDMNSSIKALTKIKEPEEILNRSTLEGKQIYDKCQSIKKYYDELLKQALSQQNEQEPFIFLYHGKKYSFTSPLSNHLNYLLKNEFLIIGRTKTHDKIAKLSIRSKTKDLQPIIKQALKNTEGRGGGHPHACGVTISENSL